MALSGMYGPTQDDEGIATIHAAIDRGVTLLDTGDFYGIGHNEMLIGRALKGRRDRVQLSVKFGALRGPDGAWLGFDTRPIAIRNAIAHSLTRLGVDHLDIYRPGRLDPKVPIEDTVGALAELVKAGYVRAIGLSEVGLETIRRACAVHAVCDLQIEYSLVSRRPEERILPALRSMGIGVTAYGLLSRGLLTGAIPRGPSDYRSYLPRFTGENARANRALAGALVAFAAARGTTPARVAVAWALAKQPHVVPLVGARTREQLDDALGALELALTADDLAELERAVPAAAVAGTRYDAQQMSVLDSER
jgi:aryl-alcohol dehydrogenase-like predicted oxidoreductase